MQGEAREPSDQEMLVNLAIYDYHAAADRGEMPDPSEWAALHPEVADELSAYFQDLAGLPLLRAQAAAGPPSTTTHVDERERAPEHTPRAAELQPGSILGDYVLLAKLGDGGQGVVWKARPQHSREIVVALKTLRGPAVNHPGAIVRLREDSRAIARMRHDNIIRTFYFGEDRKRWFFVMELMEGGTVADRLESYKADPRAAAVLIEKIARAIHHAHTRNPGVLHLDLKPGNILLAADGEPKVTDFGLSMRIDPILHPAERPVSEPAAELDPATDVTATFTEAGIVGTLPFMSPEMAGGRWSEVSTSSDIYGLGAVLYNMLTGREPYRGRDASETLALVVQGHVKGPRELNRRVDRDLSAICMKCLDLKPERRYGSADALANDLRRWRELRPTRAGGRPSAARELHFWMRRHPLTLAVMAVLAVALWIGGLAVALVDLRIENARDAARLAGQVDRELRLIRRATQILAADPRLRAALTVFPAQDVKRQRALEAFLKTAVDGENLFGIAGENPLVNVFVLEPDGVLRADTEADSPSVGRDFRVRDYYRAFFETRNPRPRDYVHVARSFQSATDARYKIAVSTRIWGDRAALMGILVANFTIGPRLIDVDMRHESGDATVLCPLDLSDPRRGIGDPGSPWSYIAILDRRYAGRPADQPLTLGPSRLAEFETDPTLEHARSGPEGGVLVDYQRVGETAMVVRLTRLPLAPLLAAGFPLTDRARNPRLARLSLQGARRARKHSSTWRSFMTWLLHNVIADMPGPQFLLLYVAVAVTLLTAIAVQLRRLDPSVDLEPLPLSFKLDAHELACLRGGGQAVLHTTLFDLWRRGFLNLVEAKSGTWQIVRAEGGPKSEALDDFERDIVGEFEKPGKVKSLHSMRGLWSRANERARELEFTLRTELLLTPSDIRATAWMVAGLAGLFLLTLAGYKLGVALAKGRHNIAFLIIGMALTMVGTGVAAYLPRITRRGSEYLDRLRVALGDVPDRFREEPDAAMDPHAVVAVALLGSTALAGTPYAKAWQEIGASWDASGLGSGGCSSGGCGGGGGGGGGCGGGGCGGGCGGCGG